MTTYNYFKKCLSEGHIFEKKALKYFKYDDVYFPKGVFKEYDFILDDKIKVEVKSDFLASQTDNMVIEFESRQKPSGIASTTADWWVYFIKYDMNNKDNFDAYKIPIKKLKRKCKKYGRIVKGGDKNKNGDCQNKMYVINKSKFKKYLIHSNQSSVCMFS